MASACATVRAWMTAWPRWFKVSTTKSATTELSSSRRTVIEQASLRLPSPRQGEPGGRCALRFRLGAVATRLHAGGGQGAGGRGRIGPHPGSFRRTGLCARLPPQLCCVDLSRDREYGLSGEPRTSSPAPSRRRQADRAGNRSRSVPWTYGLRALAEVR